MKVKDCACDFSPGFFEVPIFKAVRRGFAMASLSRKVAPAPCDGLYAVGVK